MKPASRSIRTTSAPSPSSADSLVVSSRPPNPAPRTTTRTRGRSELVGTVAALEDGDLGRSLDARLLHHRLDGLVVEELLERRRVPPLVDDHHLAVPGRPHVVDGTRGLRLGLHRLVVGLPAGPRLLDAGRVDLHPQHDNDAHARSFRPVAALYPAVRAYSAGEEAEIGGARR